MIDRRDLFRFRAYTDSFTGKYRMVYNVENTYDDGCNGVLISGNCFGDIAESHKEHKLMLCTGIKDSNGKLIYENDIIEIEYNKHRTENYQVKYGKYITCGSSIPNIGFYIQNLEDNSIWSFYSKEKTTIIGNIYETEEFMYLQGKKMSLNKNLKNKHIDEIFEFFKQDNLVAVYNNGITEIECKTANLDNIRIKKIRLLLENSTIEVHFASGAYYWTIESSGYNEKLYYDVKNILTQKHKELSNLTIDEWEEIYDYRSYVARKNKEFRKLQETDNSFLLKELEKKANWNCENEHVSSKCAEADEFSFDELKKKMVEENWSFDKPPILPEDFFSPENYSDNDEYRDEKTLKACQQGLDLIDEMVEQSNTKQDTDINIQNNSKYRRKNDGKIFFLISQHELKTTMNGITPSKEICEIVVDITKIYVLVSPALEGRYNHDILYVKENELNEDYEILSED